VQVNKKNYKYFLPNAENFQKLSFT